MTEDHLENHDINLLHREFISQLPIIQQVPKLLYLVTSQPIAIATQPV